jgi:SAM-dependent methyltransferase
MDTRAHWESVYQAKGPEQHSWYQAEAALSQRLIDRVAPSRDSRILDVGAGASRLVDGLLDSGYRAITVLDIAESALAVARDRLGARSAFVTWQHGDVRHVDLPGGSVDVWHDRAAFHFLTSPEDVAAYRAVLRQALAPGGHVVLATFADDGPERCSGLPVTRYSPAALHAAVGEGFRLVETHREVHRTPGGAEQAFAYVVCSRTDLS